MVAVFNEQGCDGANFHRGAHLPSPYTSSSRGFRFNTPMTGVSIYRGDKAILIKELHRHHSNIITLDRPLQEVKKAHGYLQTNIMAAGYVDSTQNVCGMLSRGLLPYYSVDIYHSNWLDRNQYHLRLAKSRSTNHTLRSVSRCIL